MEELVQRIVSSVGISEDTAKNAVGVIMNFFNNEGDSDLMSKITSAIPGASELLSSGGAEGEGGGGGLLGGLMSAVGGSSGGALAALASLKADGIDMDQAKGIAGEVVNFAREKVGDDTVNQMLGSIPGVGEFLGGDDTASS